MAKFAQNGVEAKRRKNADRQAGYQRKLRREVLTLLGGVCCQCGFADERALQIDHVHGGGHQERKTIPGTTFLRRVRSSLLAGHRDAYQLLCANCNWIKRCVNREYG